MNYELKTDESRLNRKQKSNLNLNTDLGLSRYFTRNINPAATFWPAATS